MKIKTLSITAAVLASAIMIIAITAGCREKNTEKPVAETERIETVQETAPETSREEKTDARNTKIYDDYSAVDNSNNSGTDRSDNDHLHSAGSDNGDDQESAEQETTLSAEELAQMVIDAGINGDARKAELGERYDEVQAWIDENYVPPVRYTEPISEDPEPYEADDYYYPDGGGVLTPSAGVNYYAGRMETYYNLDMSGVLEIMYSLGYSGEYWIRGDGVKMFGPYVMVACDFGEYPRGSVIETSLGTALVCDTGSGGWGWTDIAVTW